MLLGGDDGTFTAPVAYAVEAQPLALALADLDGDGKLDVIVANQYANTIGVLRNAGDGTFLFLPLADVGVDAQPTTIAVADLNGDGALDVVLAYNGGAMLSVLLNAGGGALAPPVDYAVMSSPAVAVGDVNGDGALDLVSSGGSVLLGHGDGTFAPRVDYPVLPGSAVAVGDVDGDGTPDVVIPSVRLAVLRNRGCLP